jgi:hypothetical protein
MELGEPPGRDGGARARFAPILRLKPSSGSNA